MADKEETDSQVTGKNMENGSSDSDENDASEGEDDIYEVEKIVGMTNNKVSQ